MPDKIFMISIKNDFTEKKRIEQKGVGLKEKRNEKKKNLNFLASFH